MWFGEKYCVVFLGLNVLVNFVFKFFLIFMMSYFFFVLILNFVIVLNVVLVFKWIELNVEKCFVFGVVWVLNVMLLWCVSFWLCIFGVFGLKFVVKIIILEVFVVIFIWIFLFGLVKWVVFLFKLDFFKKNGWLILLMSFFWFKLLVKMVVSFLGVWKLKVFFVVFFFIFIGILFVCKGV